MNIRVCDLPKEFFDDIYPRIGWYTIGFLIRDTSDIKDKPMMSGTGTLIQAGKYRGILTANHVVNRIRKANEVIFAISENQRELVKIRRELLELETIGEPEMDYHEPDIGLITIPEPAIGYINSKKSFYNLDTHRDGIRDFADSAHIGIWMLAGFPVEKEIVYKDNKTDKMIENMTLLCTTTKHPDYDNKEQYDYLDIIAVDSGEERELLTYKGFSGGGCWRTMIRKENGTIVVHSDPEYLGIPFYENWGKNQTLIRAHGPRSIYEVAYSIIEHKFT